jgi:hypothetical protein
MERFWFWSGLIAVAVPCGVLGHALWRGRQRRTPPVLDVDLDRLAAEPAVPPDSEAVTDTESRRSAMARALQRLPRPPGADTGWSETQPRITPGPPQPAARRPVLGPAARFRG